MAKGNVKKYHKNIIPRLLSKFEKGEDWEHYLSLQICSHNSIRCFLARINDFPKPIQKKIPQFVQECKERIAEKEKLEAYAEELIDLEFEKEKIRQQDIARRELEEFKNSSNPAKYLSGQLHNASYLGASKEVVEEAEQIMKRGILTGKCLEILKCTLVELNRWDKDGRLSHAFTKKVRLPEKRVEARVWDSNEVELAKHNVINWRKLDALKTRKLISN